MVPSQHRLTARLILIGFALMPALTGCKMLHKHCQDAAVTQVSESVTVGGLVNNPGSVDLGQSIQGLADVLAIAGGARVQTVAAPSQLNDQFIEAVAQSLTDQTAQVAELAVQVLNDKPIGTRLAIDSNDVRRLLEILRSMEGNRDALEDRFLVLLDRGSFEETTNNIQQAMTEIRLAIATDMARTGVTPESTNRLNEGVEDLQQAVRDAAALVDVAGVVDQGLRTVGAVANDLFVNIKRAEPSADSFVNYLYPLSFVQHGAAGGIELKNGDLVTVKEASETVLQNPISRPGNRISLTGFVRRPGAYLVGKIPTLQTVSQTSGLSDSIDKGQLCVIVKRASADRTSFDTIVLPYVDVAAGNFQSVPTSAQDEISVLPSFQAPLIAESLIGKRVRSALAQRVQRLERNQPIDSHLDKTQRALEKVFLTPGPTFRGLLQRGTTRLRGLGETLPSLATGA